MAGFGAGKEVVGVSAVEGGGEEDFASVVDTVVLQKFVEDRKIPGKGIGYAATPKISAMKRTRSLTAPFSTFLTCPFLSMFTVS